MPHYVKSEKVDARISIGGNVVICDVAATYHQQSSGLQAYDTLGESRGLWFPQARRRVANFHMGTVKYPIDIIYINDGIVEKIVHNMKPRSVGSVAHLCTDVIEVNGGWCRRNGVKAGAKVEFPRYKQAQTQDSVERVVNRSWSGPQDAIISESENQEGGIEYTGEELDKAKKADLITLPLEIEGTNCGNCLFFKDGGCSHKEIQMKVTPRMCCAYWDNKGVKRTWGTKKQAFGSSFDTLRTITEASSEDDDLESTLMKEFPDSFSKSAQENRQVKPITYREQPGEVDNRNPLERFKDHDLPDVASPEGEDNPDIQTSGNLGWNDRNTGFQLGYDVATFREEDAPYAVRSAQQVTVDPQPNSLANVDKIKLAKASVNLFDQNPPEWSDDELQDESHTKIALVTDELISNWVDSLGWSGGDNEDKIRQVVFTDDYKRLLGDALVAAGKATNYQIFDSDLILHK